MKKLVLLILSVVFAAGVVLFVFNKSPAVDIRQPPTAHELRTQQPNSTLPQHKLYLGNTNAVLQQKLTDTLGRSATYEITLKREASPWSLICGRPLEIGGQQFNYAQSHVKEQFFDQALENQFCALLRTHAKGQEIMAYDLGSLDSPVALWKTKFDLPKSLLQ